MRTLSSELLQEFVLLLTVIGTTICYVFAVIYFLLHPTGPGWLFFSGMGIVFCALYDANGDLTPKNLRCWVGVIFGIVSPFFAIPYLGFGIADALGLI